MNSRSSIALLTLGGIVALLLLLQTPLLAYARGVTWSIWVTTIARLFSLSPLTVTNDALTQMQQLQSENIRLQAELRDYKALRHELGQEAFASYRALPAAIASRPLDTFHSQYILNRGLQDGVISGSPVVVYGSTLIGFISDTHDRSSVVQLLVHPSTAITATTVPADEGRQPARGLLHGQKYTALILSTIPRDIPITEGERVVTVAKDPFIPSGLVIGTIKKVHSDVNEAYQQAELSFAYDVDRLSAIQILLPP